MPAGRGAYRAMYLRRLVRWLQSGKIRMPGVGNCADPVPAANELTGKLKRTIGDIPFVEQLSQLFRSN